MVFKTTTQQKYSSQIWLGTHNLRKDTSDKMSRFLVTKSRINKKLFMDVRRRTFRKLIVDSLKKVGNLNLNNKKDLADKFHTNVRSLIKRIFIYKKSEKRDINP